MFDSSETLKDLLEAAPGTTGNHKELESLKVFRSLFESAGTSMHRGGPKAWTRTDPNKQTTNTFYIFVCSFFFSKRVTIRNQRSTVTRRHSGSSLSQVSRTSWNPTGNICERYCIKFIFNVCFSCAYVWGRSQGAESEAGLVDRDGDAGALRLTTNNNKTTDRQLQVDGAF